MALAGGERFVFVAASGKRTEYEVELDPRSGGPVMAHRCCKILNVKTGAVGWATENWLREGPTPNAQGYFEAAA